MSAKDGPRTCPNCGEPLRSHWTVCPACEFSLAEPVCPQCQTAVKERWKRCPECQTALICSICGRRLARGQRQCPQCGPRPIQSMERLVEPVTGMEFVRVPGGIYAMGDTFEEGIENELPVHDIRVDSFYIGRFAVTQSQWNRVMPENPSKFRGDALPVEQVAWDAVQHFIQRLTDANPDAVRFRLPTEAEWEYAARSGGKNQRFAGGDDAEPVAWFADNSGGRSQPVGSKAANDLGLFDMSGNVWEWCQDHFAEDAYRRHRTENPVWHGEGEDRVIRGGSWNLDVWSVRCSRRMGFSTEFAGPALGFRLVAIP